VIVVTCYRLSAAIQTFQVVKVFEEMTVRENIRMALLIKRKKTGGLRPRKLL